jgi:hypothetical protein
MVSNRSRALLAAAALSFPALALGGCGSTNKTSSPTTTSPTTVAPTTTTTGPGTSKTTATTGPVTPPLPKSFPNSKAARQNVILSSCVSATGGWAASGTAHDPSAASGKYKITVYFTDTKATTIGYGQTEVSLTAGKTTPWKIQAKFPAPAKVLCVLVGVGAV